MAAVRASYASIYIVVATAIGVVVGIIFGAVFDDVITGRRVISVLAALAAIVAESLVRRYAASRFPRLFIDEHTARTPPPLLFVAGVIALAGGLATHDIGLVFNMMYGPVLGGFAGLFAALMSAVLVVLREEERRSLEAP